MMRWQMTQKGFARQETDAQSTGSFRPLGRVEDLRARHCLIVDVQADMLAEPGVARAGQEGKDV